MSIKKLMYKGKGKNKKKKNEQDRATGHKFKMILFGSSQIKITYYLSLSKPNDIGAQSLKCELRLFSMNSMLTH